jgi:hypothetical protein
MLRMSSTFTFAMVDQMQAVGAGIAPTKGHLDRVLTEHGFTTIVPLLQANTLASTQVDSGPDMHYVVKQLRMEE